MTSLFNRRADDDTVLVHPDGYVTDELRLIASAEVPSDKKVFTVFAEALLILLNRTRK